ncbi:tetratricopeptide repeat protein, partial [bacterium]
MGAAAGISRSALFRTPGTAFARRRAGRDAFALAACRTGLRGGAAQHRRFRRAHRRAPGAPDRAPRASGDDPGGPERAALGARGRHAAGAEGAAVGIRGAGAFLARVDLRSRRRASEARESRPMNARITAAVIASLGLSLAAAAAERKPAATVGDLNRKPVEIRRDGPATPTPAGRAMENYRRFLELQRTDPTQRADALRRLGDLSLESGELERMENEVSRIDLGGGEAIGLYTTLLKAHPDYPRNDQVLYQLARAYETTGQPDKALATLDDVVKRYPSSRDLDEVHFRRGELLFSAQRYREAEAAYAAVVKAGASRQFYQQGLYKQGWSLFKQSLNEESLPVFAKLLDLKLRSPQAAEGARRLDTLARADRELVDDTLRVMAVTFSTTDGTKPLDDFITRSGNPPWSSLLYSRLGDLYVEKQRFQDGAATYRAFVERDPNDEASPGLAMQAIEAYRKGGFAQLVLDGKR